ncbi:DUF6480 family protein [Salinifilum ghardaiensis]
MSREQEPAEETPVPARGTRPDPIEEGGAVPPGGTPPEAAQASRAVALREGASARRSTKWTGLIALGVIVLVVAVFFVTVALGLLP